MIPTIPSRLAAHMRQAVFISKARPRVGIDRAGMKTGRLNAGIAWMRLR